MPNIKLLSSDKEIFDVDFEVAQCSQTIKTMLEDLGMEEGQEELVPPPNVSSAILKKVIAWASYHKEKDDEPPAEDEQEEKHRKNNISGWDAEFVKLDHATLFELILAAKYLDIPGLLDFEAGRNP